MWNFHFVQHLTPSRVALSTTSCMKVKDKKYEAYIEVESDKKGNFARRMFHRCSIIVDVMCNDKEI